MSSRYLIQTIIVMFLMCTLMAGCTRPIVKPGGPGAVLHPTGPSIPGLQPSGPIGEQEMQAIQATLKPVYFNYDQYTLSPEAQEALRYNAQILSRTPVPVVAEGHCDERGTAEYNLALGDRRARSSVEFLAGLGVPMERLSVVSYGSELPVDPTHNEGAWSKNRRVYLRVSR